MKRGTMMATAFVLAVAAIGFIVISGYLAMQGLVFMLEVASKVTEELR